MQRLQVSAHLVPPVELDYQGSGDDDSRTQAQPGQRHRQQCPEQPWLRCIRLGEWRTGHATSMGRRT
jgi:hypothetical protein